jgi:hypothetical protein
VLPVHHRPPETLPSHQRDFPSRGKAPDILHVRDTRTLLLMVAGYLMAMLGGIVLLAALSPVTQSTMHVTEVRDAKASDK